MIQECYSISGKYVLHDPKLGQCLYHPYRSGFSIFVDALEVGLMFPLHPVIGDCLGWWQVSSSHIEPNSWCYLITFLGECREYGKHELAAQPPEGFGSVASIAAVPSPTIVPVAVDTAPAYSPFEVHENSPEEAIRKVPGFSGKHPTEASSGRRKKSKIYARHKSRRRDERSRPQANEGEKSDPPIEGASTAQPRPKSVRELCYARLEVDSQDFHAI
ncbi:hypothetical protein BHM03_00018009 [Ensete ventricosum]|nr:hypothetical protein BHM03_00018009 [Ensete ventricosum]